jgi:Lon protease-like protein
MALPPSPPEPEALTEEELAALPIFPLPRVVLLPHGHLPLHVFEPRYRAMIRDCVESGPGAIAMAMLAPGWERDYEGRPAIRTIAGVGRIVAHRQNEDGTYDLVLRGIARVLLRELPAGRHEYRRAIGEVLADSGTEDTHALRRALEPLIGTASSLAALELAGGGRGSMLELAGPPSRIADLLADRWVHDADRRQQILEATDVGARIARIGDALATLLATLSPGSKQRGGPPSN